MPSRKQDGPKGDTVTVNRAPVLTLWASVVAERLGFDRAESLTLGKTVAGLNAQSKGRALGIFTPAKKADTERKREGLRQGETTRVLLLHRAVPCVRTSEGLRALNKDRPVQPGSVERYLAGKFGDALAATRRAMEQLARTMDPETLAEEAYDLYESFRPEVPKGTRGWGKAGALSLERIRSLARPKHGGSPR